MLEKITAVAVRRTARAGLLVLVASLVLGAGALRPAAASVGSGGTSGSDTSVFVAGDSITRMSTPALRARGLDWEVDARGGRPVTSLGWVIGDRLQRGAAPQVVVVALGANARPGWDAVTGFRAMLAQLPATTTVVFVSVYRDPRYFTTRVARQRPDWNPRYSVEYTRAMHLIAAERPHTCVAPWRPWAEAHRRNLTGGVHPHHQGRRAWARIVADTVASCH